MTNQPETMTDDNSLLIELTATAVRPTPEDVAKRRYNPHRLAQTAGEGPSIQEFFGPAQLPVIEYPKKENGEPV